VQKLTTSLLLGRLLATKAYVQKITDSKLSKYITQTKFYKLRQRRYHEQSVSLENEINANELTMFANQPLRNEHHKLHIAIAPNAPLDAVYMVYCDTDIP
jgi:hypothetical protein